MTTMTDLDVRIRSIDQDMPADVVLDIRERVQFAAGVLKTLQADLELALIEWIDENGAIEIGNGQRLYVGNVKRTHLQGDVKDGTRAKAVRGVLEALLIAHAGDVGTICGSLTSNPYRYSAVREAIPEDFDSYFETETTTDLKTGKAVRKVLTADDRYQRKGQR